MTPPIEVGSPLMMPGIGGVSKDLVKSILKELILEEPGVFEEIINESIEEIKSNQAIMMRSIREIRLLLRLDKVEDDYDKVRLEAIEEKSQFFQEIKSNILAEKNESDIDIAGTTKVAIRARYVYNLLGKASIGPTGERYLDSSDIRRYLSSENVPVEYRIPSNPGKTRSTVHNTIQKVIELYGNEVRKDQKEHGNKSIMIIMNTKCDE